MLTISHLLITLALSAGEGGGHTVLLNPQNPHCTEISRDFGFAFSSALDPSSRGRVVGFVTDVGGVPIDGFLVRVLSDGRETPSEPMLRFSDLPVGRQGKKGNRFWADLPSPVWNLLSISKEGFAPSGIVAEPQWLCVQIIIARRGI